MFRSAVLKARTASRRHVQAPSPAHKAGERNAVGQRCRLSTGALGQPADGKVWLADVDPQSEVRLLHPMTKVDPIRLLLAWLSAFVANALLWPVYLIPFGPLGSLIALAALLGLALTALLIVYRGVRRGLQFRSKAAGLLINAVLPFAIMGACGIFLTGPLVEFSHAVIHGPAK